jgi:hypothetical protein
MKTKPGAAMRFAHRLAAWIALVLVAAVTLGPRVAPALDASLADVAEICAPAPSAAAPTQAPRERIPLRVPRCGVA